MQNIRFSLQPVMCVIKGGLVIVSDPDETWSFYKLTPLTLICIFYALFLVLFSSTANVHFQHSAELIKHLIKIGANYTMQVNTAVIHCMISVSAFSYRSSMLQEKARNPLYQTAQKTVILRQPYINVHFLSFNDFVSCYVRSTQMRDTSYTVRGHSST